MPHLKVNRKLEKFITTPKPIKIAIGGRGSGKSIGIGDILTFEMDTLGIDVYCLREYQDSINDSVHRVFTDSINERLKLDGWQIQENKVVSPRGNKTTYRGASRNPDSIQSAQGYLRSWFEEAHRASKASLDKLIPTIIRNPGAECWFSANPQSSADPFSQKFIVPYLNDLEKYGYYEDHMHLIVVVNWRDNPWWNKEQEALRLWDYENRPRAEYDWIWEGKFNDSVDNAIILPEWFDAAVDAHRTESLRGAFRPHGARVASYDPADGGNDAAGFAIRHGSIIECVASQSNTEIDKNCDWALDKAIQGRCDWFVWDGDGMGTGLKGQIDKALRGKQMDYHMFRGSLSGIGQDNAKSIYNKQEGENVESITTYADTFKNNRSQYYWGLAQKFHNTYRAVTNGEYIDPADMIALNSDGIEDMQALRSQLCRIPQKVNGQGLIQIMSKQDMAKQDIKSPNEGDAVMMTGYQPKLRRVVQQVAARGWNG